MKYRNPNLHLGVFCYDSSSDDALRGDDSSSDDALRGEFFEASQSSRLPADRTISKKDYKCPCLKFQNVVAMFMYVFVLMSWCVLVACLL